MIKKDCMLFAAILFMCFCATVCMGGNSINGSALQMYINNINEVIKDEDWLDGRGAMSLIYIDNDDLPELVINWGFSARGCQVCTVSDGKLVCTTVGDDGVSYIERQNIFLNSGVRRYHYSDTVYAIQNGEFAILHNGEYVEKNIDDVEYYCRWDGKEVTESEYEEKLRSAFDRSKSISSSKNACSAAEMFQKINALLYTNTSQ